MASLKYHKDVKRWRVFWHVTLPDGTVDKGSRSFKGRPDGERFKEKKEREEKLLKRAIFVQAPLLSDVLDDWRDHLQRHTVRTRELYEYGINDFLKYLPENVIFMTDLTTNHVNRYINSLMSKGLKNKSINNNLCAIKSLCRYAQENYHIDNPAIVIKKLKEDPVEVNFLTIDEYRLILEHIDDIALVWVKFLAHTGLRASEFKNLRWKNYHPQLKSITIIGKGKKRRTIGLNQIAIDVLDERRKGRKVKPDDHIFYRKDGEPLIRRTLSHYISKACGDAGIRQRGPHAFRHFFATQLLLAGVPIIKVSILLGHASITTTQKHYSHILSPDLTDVTGILEAI
jgi:integrase/recombinase XerC